MNINGLEHQLPAAQPFSSINNQGYSTGRIEAKYSLPKSIGFPPSKVSPESIHSNFSEKSPAEDEDDVCIIEGISDPAPTQRFPVVSSTRYPAPSTHPLAVGSSIVSSQQSSDNDTGVGGMRFRTRDEQLILRVALQVRLRFPKYCSSMNDGKDIYQMFGLLRNAIMAYSLSSAQLCANRHFLSCIKVTKVDL